MTPSEILEDIRSKIMDDDSIAEALWKFVNHFSCTNVEGCNKNDDSDMLLFQWGGPYDWDNSYTVNLTRQFSHSYEDGEYAGMEQLQMKCKFDPSGIDVPSGNKWHEGEEISDFIKFIENSDIISVVKEMKIREIVFELSEV